MNISKYIEELEKIKNEHGDLELVEYFCDDFTMDFYCKLEDEFPCEVVEMVDMDTDYPKAVSRVDKKYNKLNTVKALVF